MFFFFLWKCWGLLVKWYVFLASNFCFWYSVFVCAFVFFFLSFNKPISLASLFAAMSSFLVRFRKLVNSEQSSSSERSGQSNTPSQTRLISIQELGSDLQLNWFGRLQLEILFGWWAAFGFFICMFFCEFVVSRVFIGFEIVVLGGGKRWFDGNSYRDFNVYKRLNEF